MTKRRGRGNNEGSIRKRQDGRWEGRFTADGKQRSVYARTREEAARKLRVAMRTADRGLPLTSQKLTVAQYLAHWLVTSVKPSVRPRTYDAYESHVRLHLSPAIGKIPLSKLHPSDVQHLLNNLGEGGLSPNTVLRVRATLRRALNQAMKWDLVARNAAVLVNPPKAEKYKVEPITPREAAAILQAVEGHRLQTLFEVLLGCGLRIGEALGLQWQDVDLVECELTVDKALQKRNGEFKLVPPKADSARRNLPVASFLVDSLRRHRAAQGRERLLAGDQWADWDLVFATDKGRPLDGSNVLHTFHRLLDQAGLPPRRLHDLRHGCASLLLAKGVSARVVMETLGHSQIGLTLNTYAHVIPTLQREAADRMDEVLHGKERA